MSFKKKKKKSLCASGTLSTRSYTVNGFVHLRKDEQNNLCAQSKRLKY